MQTDADSATHHSVFVHDFSPVELGFADAGAAMVAVLTHDAMAHAVRTACLAESLLNSSGAPATRGWPQITLGEARWRADAVVVRVAWEFPSDDGMALDADLELAAYTADRCHLHLLGRVPLEQGMSPSTQASSLYGRQAVAVIRHLLNDLSHSMTQPVLGGTR